MSNPPIFRFNDERRVIVDEVVARTVNETHDALFALNDAAFNEIKRLETRPSLFQAGIQVV